MHNSDLIAKIRADNFNKTQDRFSNKKIYIALFLINQNTKFYAAIHFVNFNPFVFLLGQKFK